MVQFFEKYIRVGRILELMDYIASNVAYRYCIPGVLSGKEFEDLPFFVVTAAIDEIDFFHPILADKNCSFCGYVTYVGVSSMEVQICVRQLVDSKERLTCTANFVMAARDKKSNKDYKVPVLVLTNEPQNLKIKNELAMKRQKMRKH
jgi:acyl-coenzyme A thioesterase 9